MDTLEHPQSYYAATARPFPQLPELQGETEADVAIIGGGYTGLSAALHLAERGYKSVLIDQARIGKEFYPFLLPLLVIVLALEYVTANRFYPESP